LHDDDSTVQPGWLRHSVCENAEQGVFVPSQRPEGFVTVPSGSVHPQPGMSRHMIFLASSGRPDVSARAQLTTNDVPRHSMYVSLHVEPWFAHEDESRIV
jgi:hypothetical protein